MWGHIKARRTSQGLDAAIAEAQQARYEQIAALRKESARLKAEARALTARAEALLEQAAKLGRQK